MKLVICDRAIYSPQNLPRKIFPGRGVLEFLNEGYVRFRLHIYITAQGDGPACASIVHSIVGQQTGKSHTPRTDHGDEHKQLGCSADGSRKILRQYA